MRKKLLFSLLTLILTTAFSYAQITVSGTVTDASGETLPGVSIMVKGTTQGTATDFDGAYEINASEGDVLVFSFIGFATKEVAVTSSTVNVSLAEDTESLDEVVVTALGIKKEEKALGYSLTSVKGDEMNQVKTTSAMNALQGRVAGVNVSTSSTGASGSSRVIIRGASSLSGDNQPLYVIDGIPMINTTKASVGTENGQFGDGGDDISGINPDDIASVSVLKGSSAAALYGSLASNGVIMITTKSGKGQQGFGVEFSSSFTFNKVNTDLIDFQTTYGQGRSGLKPGFEWLRDDDGNPLNQVPIEGVEAQITDAFDSSMSSWGSKFDDSPVYYWKSSYIIDGNQSGKAPYSYLGNPMEDFYNVSSTAVNSIALTKGGEDFSYRFSVSNLDNKDLMPNTTLKRQSYALNARAQINPKLTSTVNVRYIIDKVHNRVGIGTWPGNANFTAMILPSNIDIEQMKPGHIPEGTIMFDGTVPESGTELLFQPSEFTQNPYWVSNHFNNNDKKNRLISAATIRYDFTEWLYATGRAGLDTYDFSLKQVSPYGTAYAPLGRMTQSKQSNTVWDADFMLGIDKELIGKISTNSFIGGNMKNSKFERITSNGLEFIVVGLEDLGNTKEKTTSYGYAESQMNSIYGSFEFDYDKFAYLTFTGRNDWFSTLSYPGKTTPNDDFYWSISGSFLIDRIFDFDSEAINFLKLRSSYAQVAGGARSPYQLSQDYAILETHLGNAYGTINGSNIANINLVPFQKDEFEVGLDGRFFANRLSIDFAYYQNETSDDIVASKASSTSGYTTAIVNAGKLENKGIELLISGYPIRNDDFSWNISYNMGYNKSEITHTNEFGTGIGLAESRTHTAQIRQEIGDPFGSIYGYAYKRDDAGNIMYDTTNPDLPKPLQGEFVKLGEGVSPLTMGLTNSFRYKDLAFNFLIDAKFGGQVFSGTNAYAYLYGKHKETLKGREEGLIVTGVDQDGNPFNGTVRKDLLRSYYSHINDKIAEEFIYDTDFIKFREVSLSYSIPKDFLGDNLVSDFKIALVGRNLFYLMKDVDNIDPEAALNNSNGQGLERFGVPATRSYGFSINVKF